MRHDMREVRVVGVLQCGRAPVLVGLFRSRRSHGLAPRASGYTEQAPTFNGEHMAENNLSLWTRDDVQFPRLLAEICATQDALDIPALAESMDLTVAEVNSLFDRAQTAWETIKARSRTAEADSISEERIVRFIHDAIENGNMDAEDLPAKIARYGLMDPADFADEMRERIADQTNEGEVAT